MFCYCLLLFLALRFVIYLFMIVLPIVIAGAFTAID